MTALANALSSTRHSCAVIAQSHLTPDTIVLGVRGPGAKLCIGLAPMGWIVATEPHGISGETNRFLRVAEPEPTLGTQAGSVLTLSRKDAGDIAGLRRYHLDETPHPVRPHEIETLTER